jgi:hypothetical protein
MNDLTSELCAVLRDTMDPDQIVDFLAIGSVDLVDALVNYIDDWIVEHDWSPEDDINDYS